MPLLGVRSTDRQSPLIQGPILSHYRCGPTAERLGHLSAQITLDTYSHLLPGIREEAAKTFDDALGREVAQE